jgi:putative transposase
MVTVGDDGRQVSASRHSKTHNGKPEIVNTDQGAQLTGSAFSGVPAKHSIAISMDGKGA